MTRRATRSVTRSEVVVGVVVLARFTAGTVPTAGVFLMRKVPRRMRRCVTGKDESESDGRRRMTRGVRR